MEYSAPRLPVLQSRFALVLAAAAVVILVIVLAFFLFGRGSDAPQDDVSQLPVSGINDTTGTADDAAEEDIEVEVAPTSARITYSVKEGDQVYAEIYTDGSETPTPELLEGPVEKTAETTSTWTITTFTPDLIEITVNGEKVNLAPSEDYGGMYAYTVDFPAMLDQWRQTHSSSKSSQRQAAVNSAVNAANQSSSDSSSKTSQNAQGDQRAASQSSQTDTSDASSGNTASSG